MSKRITSGQKHQIKRFADLALEAVFGELNLSEEALLRLVKSGPDFREELEQHFSLVLTGLLDPQQFANEQVKSNSGYLSGYCNPRSVTEQVDRLRELFPGIGYADESLADLSLPQGAEGLFVFPPWQRVATTYGEAVQIVLDKLHGAYGGKLVNYIEGKLGVKYLRESAAKKAALWQLAEEQRGFDLLVVPGQFGFLHRGRAVRCARVAMRNDGQFGFGAFENGIMLLTHPDRLGCYDDLWLDCAGDRCSHEPDGLFPFAPVFRFSGRRFIEIGADGVSDPRPYCGASSGFLFPGR